MTAPRIFPGMTSLITGASSGIGESFARELASQGSHLILVARSEEKLKQLAEELIRCCGIRVTIIAADLSDPESPHKIFERVQQEKLRVDLLINNAGFAQQGFFENLPKTEVRQMMNVNIHSLVFMTHLFLPDLLKRQKGGIINIASTAAFQPLPYISLYAATKAFVLNFTEGLWGECKNRGVRIFCLCPGNTRTAFHKKASINRVFLTASPKEVAQWGLRVYRSSNRPTAVYGFFNSLLTQGYRFAPRSLVVNISRLIYRD